MRHRTCNTDPSSARHWAILLIVCVLAGCVSGLVHAETPPATLERNLLEEWGHSYRIDLVINPVNPDIMYLAATRKGVLKSEDRGVTWSAMNAGLPTLRTEAIAMDPTDPGHLIVSLDDGSRPYRWNEDEGRWEPTVVCEHQDEGNPVNLTNLRETGFAWNRHYDISFDPLDPSSFYLPLKNQKEYCGGFYRSCDGGQSYDHNPRCYESFLFLGGITPLTPRPACAAGDPPPQYEAYPFGNDADLFGFDTDAGAMFVGTAVHNEYALMTSYDKGVSFTWDNVLDTQGSFVQKAPATVASLYANGHAVAPSDSGIRYAGFAGGVSAGDLNVICPDGKAYPIISPCPALWPECPAQDLPACGSGVHQRLPGKWVFARWSGDAWSGDQDCEDTNDCDGDDSPDRVWRPIYEAPDPHEKWGSILVAPTDPNRVFVIRGEGGTFFDVYVQLLMLTPSDPSDPDVTPWNATVIFDEEEVPQKLFHDPSDPDSFYLLTFVYDYPASEDRDNRLYRLTKPVGGWETWDSNGACEEGDPNCELLLTTGASSSQVYDFVEYEGGVLAGTTAGTCLGFGVGSCYYGGDACEFDSDCATGPCELIQCTQHDPRPVVSITVASTGRVYIRDRDTRANDDHFGGPYGVLFFGMDIPWHVRKVMCTSVVHDLVVDPDDETLLYAATGAGIWIHPNGHVTVDNDDRIATSLEWEELARTGAGLADEYIWSLAFDPSDSSNDTMLAGSRSGAIYRSLDRGQNWVEQPVFAPPSFLDALADVKDFAFLDDHAFAATAAGVLVRTAKATTWTASLADEPIENVAVGASGNHRVYAIGPGGVFRSFDLGASWETVDLDITPPQGHGAVLETVEQDGRHHLWVADDTLGIHVASTEVSASAGFNVGQCQVAVDLGTDDPFELVGAKLHYGTDPDLLGGTGANEGDSPITLGAGTSATLTGLGCDSETQYVVLESTSGVRGLPLEVDFDRLFVPQIETQSVTGICPLEVQLTWTPVPGALGYRVLRSGGGQCCGFQQISGDFDIDLTTVTFTDPGTLFDRTYYYKVEAVYLTENTNPSESVYVTTPDEYDPDEDGWAAPCDNCAWVYNPDQIDDVPFPGGNGIGDVCECSVDADCEDLNRCTIDECLFEFGSPYGECRHLDSCP